ncbi:hypothetical protein Bhyg_01376 [Pseudolycoriella hygida]|uniref:Uncharacterized protein n=1 Tax=Pseudolycoriella hygida TaxID=35572 RepID=A0A9Q0S7H3_9DIPT|nr:hypothetical protein Bhyg_01376 [Pseudolycoriella hygida]
MKGLNRSRATMADVCDAFDTVWHELFEDELLIREDLHASDEGLSVPTQEVATTSNTEESVESGGPSTSQEEDIQ